MQNGGENPNDALAGSTDLLHLMGHLCFGYVLAMSAKAAQDALDNGEGNSEFYQEKLNTIQHYFTRHLPFTELHLKRIQAGSDTIMSPTAASF